jgi:hypothetical protein
MVAGQKIALGRIHARRIVTVHVTTEVITIDAGGDDTRTVCRTTNQPVRSIKAHQSVLARRPGRARRGLQKPFAPARLARYGLERVPTAGSPRAPRAAAPAVPTLRVGFVNGMSYQ